VISPPRLQLAGITKAYPGVVANRDISLVVQPGEIHAVLGENGAGKSTLMKIIYGAAKPDAGTMAVDGVPALPGSPQAARALGISMVFQHFSLFDTLTVAENVWLGLGKTESLASTTQQVTDTAAAYGLDIDPARHVHSLSVGQMQRVEIIRALLAQPKLLILDEPTSVLTPQAVEKLFVVLRQLSQAGCSILYISHKLHEIRELCTACTVLRGGSVTGVCNPAQESNASLSRLMIGKEPPALQRTPGRPGAEVLRITTLSMPREDQFGVDLDAIDLQVFAGEVVGIAGISGNGQKELMLALSGENPTAPAGSVRIKDGTADTDVSQCGPIERRKLGLHFVPEERLGRGAVPAHSLSLNMLLTRSEALSARAVAGGWINTRALAAQANTIIERFGVKAGGPQALAKSLSGGNLQKFIMGREIDARPKLLIVSQPTWGVDVGAAAQIRSELLALSAQGCAVLVVSEEIDELFEISDRLYVMAKGRLSPSIDRADASVEQIGLWMSGLWDTGHNPGQPSQTNKAINAAA
jgi:general nucleoside transport system ATP-binding protein